MFVWAESILFSFFWTSRRFLHTAKFVSKAIINNCVFKTNKNDRQKKITTVHLSRDTYSPLDTNALHEPKICYWRGHFLIIKWTVFITMLPARKGLMLGINPCIFEIFSSKPVSSEIFWRCKNMSGWIKNYALDQTG